MERLEFDTIESPNELCRRCPRVEISLDMLRELLEQKEHLINDHSPDDFEIPQEVVDHLEFMKAKLADAGIGMASETVEPGNVRMANFLDEINVQIAAVEDELAEITLSCPGAHGFFAELTNPDSSKEFIGTTVCRSVSPELIGVDDGYSYTPVKVFRRIQN
jgi:hypothetical protein